MTDQNLSAGAAGTHAAAKPHELLQQLAGWMSASGYAADHPWQVAIAATLASEAAPQQSPRELAAVMLFEAIATNARGLIDSLDDGLESTEGNPHYMPMRAAFGLIGCLTDEGVRLFGHRSMWGGPRWWLLNSAQG